MSIINPYLNYKDTSILYCIKKLETIYENYFMFPLNEIHFMVIKKRSK